MHDDRIAIWNLLHDGEITAVAGEGSDTLTMFVSIPYLRRRLAPLGDSLVLTLTGVTAVAFEGLEGTKTSLGAELDLFTPEILSTESHGMPVEVVTTTGKLVLAFASIRLSLDTGQAVTFGDVERVSREYWDEWEARMAKARRPAEGS